MDSSDEAKEVSFRRHGTTDLDRVRDDSSEGSTVQVPVPIADQGRTPTVTTPDDEQTVKSEENLNSILAYLVDEIKSIKVSLNERSSGKAAKSSVFSPVRSLTDEDEEDSVSTQSSRIGHLIPSDQGRWKSSKAAVQARDNFTQILKDLDISNNEENWAKWDSYFHMLVESLELPTFVFEDIQPAPTTLSELMASLADGNKKEIRE